MGHVLTKKKLRLGRSFQQQGTVQVKVKVILCLFKMAPQGAVRLQKASRGHIEVVSLGLRVYKGV